MGFESEIGCAFRPFWCAIGNSSHTLVIELGILEWYGK